jgi:MoxR-like ATPase
MSSELEQPESFDYTQLDAETREIMLRATRKTQSLLQRTAEHIIAIGHNLRLAQWPSPLDALAFEAEDWTRLAQMAELTRRVLDACRQLTQASSTRIVEGSSEEPGERRTAE